MMLNCINNAGIMHFYTEGEKIFLPSDSSFMFYYFFSLSEISGISNWDTSNVTDMKNMFQHAGHNATTFALNLSSWDTFNVTDMSYMFNWSGNYATNWFIGDLSSWNTSNVTNMSSMFYRAGYSATTWSVTIPHTNGNSINNTTSRLYGKTTSTYAAPPSGKSFTLAE